MVFEKAQQLQRVFAQLVPRPGVEPGLEVPETSVMSFSLPGRRQTEIYQAMRAGQATKWRGLLRSVAIRRVGVSR